MCRKIYGGNINQTDAYPASISRAGGLGGRWRSQTSRSEYEAAWRVWICLLDSLKTDWNRCRARLACRRERKVGPSCCLTGRGCLGDSLAGPSPHLFGWFAVDSVERVLEMPRKKHSVSLSCCNASHVIVSSGSSGKVANVLVNKRQPCLPSSKDWRARAPAFPWPSSYPSSSSRPSSSSSDRARPAGRTPRP